MHTISENMMQLEEKYLLLNLIMENIFPQTTNTQFLCLFTDFTRWNQVMVSQPNSNLNLISLHISNNSFILTSLYQQHVNFFTPNKNTKMLTGWFACQWYVCWKCCRTVHHYLFDTTRPRVLLRRYQGLDSYWMELPLWPADQTCLSHQISGCAVCAPCQLYLCKGWPLHINSERWTLGSLPVLFSGGYGEDNTE